MYFHSQIAANSNWSIDDGFGDAAKRSLVLDKIYPFVLGLFLWVPVNFVGTLPVTELIVLVFSPLLILSNHRRWLRLRNVRTVIGLLLLWCVGQIVSDVVNGTDSVLRLKGMAMIAFVTLSFMTYACLFYDKPKRILVYLLGATVGGFYRPLFGYDMTLDQGLSGGNFFDLYISFWANPLLLLATFVLYKPGKNKLLVAFILLAYGSLAIVLGGRANALMFYAAAFMLLYSRNSAEVTVAHSRKRIINFFLSCVAMFGLSFVTYVSLGKSGRLGIQSQQQLNNCRNPYNPIEVFNEGRGMFWLAVEAVKERPIWGHGYGKEDRRFAIDLGRSRHGYRIAGHSVILESWTAAGFMGGLAWICLMWIYVKAGLKFLTVTNSKFKPMLFFGIAAGIWHLLFSPMGYARFEWPPMMALACILASQNNLSGIIQRRSKLGSLTSSSQMDRAQA